MVSNLKIPKTDDQCYLASNVTLNLLYKSTTLKTPKVANPVKKLWIENNLFKHGIS